VLPAVISAFRRKFPGVGLEIHQGTPQQVVDMAQHDQVDFAICTETLGDYPALTALPIYRWNRSLIAPHGHPVLTLSPLGLEQICEYPLITYTFGFTGTRHMQATFARAGLKPKVVLSAVDADVIKTYVREGLGIGLIATTAYSAERDTDLVSKDLRRLLPWETVWIGFRKEKYLRRYQQAFVDLMDRMTGENGRVNTAGIAD
jgi:LysR family cys regulon transcriptional activator